MIALSRPLQTAIENLKVEFPSGRALVDDLPADAAFAIATADLDDVIVRLLTLVSLDDLGDRHGYEVFDLITKAGWLQWDIPAVQAIATWADAWWLTTLMTQERPAGDVLGELVHLELPMVKWLATWLEELDGPGAVHLANYVIDGSGHPGWEGYADEQGQVRAWTQSDAVVNGFTMIGGVHLEPGRLSHVLDRIIVTPGLPTV